MPDDTFSQARADIEALRKAMSSGGDTSMSLTDRINAAVAAGDWKLSARLKTELQAEQARERRHGGLDFTDGEQSLSLLGQIRAAEEARDFQTSARLKTELTRLRADVARQERLIASGDDPEAKERKLEAHMAKLAESNSSTAAFVRKVLSD